MPSDTVLHPVSLIHIEEDDDDDTTGVIIGTVVGGVLLLILVILVLFTASYVLFHHRIHGEQLLSPSLFLLLSCNIFIQPCNCAQPQIIATVFKFASLNNIAI